MRYVLAILLLAATVVDVSASVIRTSRVTMLDTLDSPASSTGPHTPEVPGESGEGRL